MGSRIARRSWLGILLCLLLPRVGLAQPTTTRVSVGPGGAQGDGDSGGPAVSADGRWAVFSSAASNLVVGDTNGHWDTFVFDQQSGTTTRVSVGPGGIQGNGDSGRSGISADGRWVLFSSDASNLVANDTNGSRDVFLRDQQSGTTTRLGWGWAAPNSVVPSGRP